LAFFSSALEYVLLPHQIIPTILLLLIRRILRHLLLLIPLLPPHHRPIISGIEEVAVLFGAGVEGAFLAFLGGGGAQGHGAGALEGCLFHGVYLLFYLVGGAVVFDADCLYFFLFELNKLDFDCSESLDLFF